jgi:peptidoglycan/LPS O-acetylase OafA/YrhL
MGQLTAQQRNRPEKIHALTSLRFFAALFVVCFHALWVTSFLPFIKHDSLPGRCVGLGYTSVSFFFLVSGYIPGVVYLSRGGVVPLGAFFRVVGQGLVVFASRHGSGELVKRLPLLHITTFALGILLARWQTLRREKGTDIVAGNSQGIYAVLGLVIICTVAVVYWSPKIPLFNLHDGLLAPIFLCVIWAFSHSQWQPARLLSGS